MCPRTWCTYESVRKVPMKLSGLPLPGYESVRVLLWMCREKAMNVSVICYECVGVLLWMCLNSMVFFADYQIVTHYYIPYISMSRIIIIGIGSESTMSFWWYESYVEVYYMRVTVWFSVRSKNCIKLGQIFNFPFSTIFVTVEKSY